MSTAAQKRLDASPRRHVRWIYLRDAWADAPTSYSADAILAAPEDAIVTAIARDAEHYRTLLNDERARARQAEHELEQLRQAISVVLTVAAQRGVPLYLLDEPEQLDLFDDDPGYVDVPVGNYL